MTKGLIFNIQEYSINDGKGIRTTIFFKGCPLSCKWCCNPEGRNMFPELMYFRVLCKGHFNCANSCPYEAVENINGFPSFKREICSGCQEKPCIDSCPGRALKQSGKYYSPEELIEEILPSMNFFRMSEGGITLSGGEPLIQQDFIRAFLSECEKYGIGCGLETCGYFDITKVTDFIGKFEFIYYDIKTTNPSGHLEYTGVDFGLIKNNLSQLTGIFQNDIIISTPIIPGFNDNETEIKNIAELCVNFGIKKIRLLPYHNFGAGKYEELGISYSLSETKIPPTITMNYFKNILLFSGLEVVEL